MTDNEKTLTAISANQRLFSAYVFANGAHSAVGQLRKYTLEPYIVHPVEVAGYVMEAQDATVEMVQAALLHDVVEDTQVSIITIDRLFGSLVARYVLDLTDYFTSELFPDWNRAKRKDMEAFRLKSVPPSVKTIKLADGLSNTSSIGEHDTKFLKVYGPEKRAVLENLRGGDPVLWDRLDKQLKALGF